MMSAKSKQHERENLLHSAQDISPRARLSSISSSVDTLRNCRRELFNAMLFEVSTGMLRLATSVSDSVQALTRAMTAAIATYRI